MLEIRVAVIGHASVGKTTVINALIGEKCRDKAKKHITTGVNECRTYDATKEGDEDRTSSDVDSVFVQERTYDSALDTVAVAMPPDTKLVIVDISGLNKVGVGFKYKDYVAENWHTFDVVVLVMDARLGVKAEEYLFPLQLAKEAKPNIPLIVLSNKVDDLYNSEQNFILAEARHTIEKMFRVNECEVALQANLDQEKESPPLKSNAGGFPLVIPISAMNAFVYRCGSHLSLDDFRKMDRGFIDHIGKDSYGRKTWKGFGREDQVAKAYDAVTNPVQCADGLEASNFGTFTKALSKCIGDEVVRRSTQTYITVQYLVATVLSNRLVEEGF